MQEKYITVKIYKDRNPRHGDGVIYIPRLVILAHSLTRAQHQ